jgi:large subunit ribosomal protein L4
MTHEVLSVSGELKDKVELPDAVFGEKVRKGILWEATKAYLANQRQGTAKTKTRAEVSGGGKKPWRQKGTGRARHGSTRSPIWRHGGTVFGPHPRDYDLKVPVQKKALALRIALSSLLKENRIRVVEDFAVPSKKTRDLVRILADLGLKKESVLLLTGEPDPGLKLAARNIAALTLKRARDLNVYAALNHDVALFTVTGLAEFLKLGTQEKGAA